MHAWQTIWQWLYLFILHKNIIALNNMNVDVFYSRLKKIKWWYIFRVKKNDSSIYLWIIFVKDFTDNFLNHIFQGYYLIHQKSKNEVFIKNKGYFDSDFSFIICKKLEETNAHNKVLNLTISQTSLADLYTPLKIKSSTIPPKIQDCQRILPSSQKGRFESISTIKEPQTPSSHYLHITANLETGPWTTPSTH